MSKSPNLLTASIEALPLNAFKPNPRNARMHSARQSKQIADSIREFGFVNPILIDEQGVVIAGRRRLAAAHRLGMIHAPALRVDHLNEDQKPAYVLADNQLATRAGWDASILAIELQHLSEIEIEFDVTVTGSESPEIDVLLHGSQGNQPEDPVEPIDRTAPAITGPGDVWRLGPRKLICGDALDMATLAALMGRDLAKIVFADPPYNVKIAGFVRQSRRLAHREFAMAVGEMSEAEFTRFLEGAMSCFARFSAPGAVQFWFQDWRHQFESLSAARAVGLDALNT